MRTLHTFIRKILSERKILTENLVSITDQETGAEFVVEIHDSEWEKLQQLAESKMKKLIERIVTIKDMTTGEEILGNIDDEEFTRLRQKSLLGAKNNESALMDVIHSGEISVELPVPDIIGIISHCRKAHGAAAVDLLLHDILNNPMTGLQLFSPSTVDEYFVKKSPPAAFRALNMREISKAESMQRRGVGELTCKFMFGHDIQKREPDVTVPIWGGLAVKGFDGFNQSSTVRVSSSPEIWSSGFDGEVWEPLRVAAGREFGLAKQVIAIKLALASKKFESVEDAATSLAMFITDAGRTSIEFEGSVRAMMAVDTRTGDMQAVNIDDIRGVSCTIGNYAQVGAPIAGDPLQWLVDRLMSAYQKNPG